MQYLRISSILLAFFFIIGCGSKSVDSSGGTSQTTEQKTLDNEQTSNGEDEAIADNNRDYGPEGAFMPLNNGSGDSDYNDNGNISDNDSNNNDGSGYGVNSVDGNQGDDTLAANGEDENIDSDGNIVIDSLTTIYFDFDRYNIRPDMKGYVRANAEYIKSQNIKAVVLQGNTDEFGGDEYNMALGQKRALAVKDALVLHGLPATMFSTISYGTHKPVCKEKTSECYAKNRRTDLVEKR